jgi:Domain of unknown function (DUF4345)
MSLIQILQIVAALGTIATGLFSLIAPTRVTGFTGLQPVGGRGVTEIRAVLGGLFIGLGAAPFFLGATAYLVLGIAYLAIAAVRAVSIVVDRSAVQSNIISLLSEIVLGVVLVL